MGLGGNHVKLVCLALGLVVDVGNCVFDIHSYLVLFWVKVILNGEAVKDPDLNCYLAEFWTGFFVPLRGTQNDIFSFIRLTF